MRFFSRRGRSRSADRATKSRRDGHYEQRIGQRNDKRNGVSGTCEDSIGSELPTLDQFEIAVPSKSFASATSIGDHHNSNYAVDTREDEGGDNRSCTDISSITSVSYRAGYYYLRNVKKKAPEKKKKTGCQPPCSCNVCMPCGCSWLTCCCCQEAKSELATAAATSGKHSSIGLSPREKVRRLQSPPRRAKLPQEQLLDHTPPGTNHRYSRRPHNLDNNRRRGSSSKRRYGVSGGAVGSRLDRYNPMHTADECRVRQYPSLKRNHSLFDELSEDDDMPGHSGEQRERRQHHQLHHRQNQKRNKNKPWLRGRAGATGSYGPQPDYQSTRDKTSRGRSRGTVSRREQH